VCYCNLGNSTLHSKPYKVLLVSALSVYDMRTAASISSGSSTSSVNCGTSNGSGSLSSSNSIISDITPPIHLSLPVPVQARMVSLVVAVVHAFGDS
jgi:hypothetical protein